MSDRRSHRNGHTNGFRGPLKPAAPGIPAGGVGDGAVADGSPMSIERAYAGRHVLLTGGSGFLGKVWLSMLLHRLPDMGRIYVLLRPKALSPAHRRFERLINDSPAFRPLHEKFGPALSDYLAERVEVVQGDLEAPGLGLAAGLASRLRRDVDLVVHCAGLVDFDPPLDKALAANVDATLHVADFVQGCRSARLLHISTAYVAGERYGTLPEQLTPNYRPRSTGAAGDGVVYDAVTERAAAAEEIEAIRAELDRPEAGRGLVAEARALLEASQTGSVSGRESASVEPSQNLVRRVRRERLRAALQTAGMARATSHGFPNTYTYTKSLAESLLHDRRDRLRMSIFRPTIVESALSYPFPGWNESFNGSAPLAYVMGSWYRSVPARPDAPFDVIPVDQVANAMSICGAALLEGRASEVYQVGTSDRNRCSVGRAAELITLAHRQYNRQRGRQRAERIVKSRWDAVLTDPDHLFGVAGLRAAVDSAQGAIDLLPDKLRQRAERLDARVRDVDSDLSDIEKMVSLYKPFMHDSWYVFLCRAIERHPALEPAFRFEPESIQWRHYWLRVHMPGLRRWAFPLIEGKRPERYRALHKTTLPPPPDDEVMLPELPATPSVPRT